MVRVGSASATHWAEVLQAVQAPAAQMGALAGQVAPVRHCTHLLVVVSQSGETADVLEAMDAAKKKGAKVLSIVNVAGSTIARTSDYSLKINAGPEKAVASTKAATSQLAVLMLIAYAIRGELQEGRRVLAETASAVNDMLNPRFLTYVKDVAESIKSHENAYIIGKAENYPMALEAAIKIQEVSYMHAEGFAAGELKHGPIALVEDGQPVVIILPSPRGRESLHSKVVSNVQEVRARGARTFVIAEEGDTVAADYAENVFYVPKAPVLLSPLLTVVPLHLFALELASAKGHDVDQPRNLAKSVTVE